MFSFPSHFSADDPLEPLDDWTREENRAYLAAVAERARWQRMFEEAGAAPDPINNLDYAV